MPSWKPGPEFTGTLLTLGALRSLRLSDDTPVFIRDRRDPAMLGLSVVVDVVQVDDDDTIMTVVALDLDEAQGFVEEYYDGSDEEAP